MPSAKMPSTPLVLLQPAAPRTPIRMIWFSAQLTHVGSVPDVASVLPVGGIAKPKCCFRRLAREQFLLLPRLCFRKVLAGLGSSVSVKRISTDDTTTTTSLLLCGPPGHLAFRGGADRSLPCKCGTTFGIPQASPPRKSHIGARKFVWSHFRFQEML